MKANRKAKDFALDEHGEDAIIDMLLAVVLFFAVLGFVLSQWAASNADPNNTAAIKGLTLLVVIIFILGVVVLIYAKVKKHRGGK